MLSTRSREYLNRLRKQLKATAMPAVRFKDGRNRRSLIVELLALQLAFAIFVSIIAIGGLWWTSKWVIDDNLAKWGQQWISQLDDLGVPLYTSQDPERYLSIEQYINTFPEIGLVRYYSPDAKVIFESAAPENLAAIKRLSADSLQDLAGGLGSKSSAALDSPIEDLPYVRISKAVWTESIVSDGLLDFDPAAEQAVQAELVGFVELILDFSGYQAQLNRNILSGSLLSIIVLMLLTMSSWLIFRRALQPLSELQQPLKKLADGETDFKVNSSGHKEIVAIANALNTTVTALNERDHKLWQLANHDPLTGLVNRHRFSEHLTDEVARIRVTRGQSALLFIDLDQFKYVNDTLGHTAGDRLLKQAAERLRSGVRQEDTVSRFGGDEFTLLLKDVSEPQVKAICETLLQDMMDHQFVESGKTFSIPCSIGATMLSDTHYTPAEFLAQADMACHDAKALGRNRFQFYKASGQELNQMAADVGWSQQIQRALADDLFVLHYQPIVDIRRGEPTHYEALLRMKLEDGQLVPPAAFLPAATRFGLMTQIDQYVIRTALRALARFRRNRGNIRFTLNVSGNIFEDTDLWGCVEENLKLNELPADAIILEITEQVAVRNIVTANKQIQEMRKLGCQFAIDDFGAGYSSYTYLKNLPVDYIKIDGSFIRNLAEDEFDQTIVRSIIDIARMANKKTIAEHVGNEKTYALLLEFGVDLAQGFYLGKPSPRLSRRKIPVPIRMGKKRRKGAA
jgi:diguanylate cyclase (GGDEF)-like protein